MFRSSLKRTVPALPSLVHRYTVTFALRPFSVLPHLQSKVDGNHHEEFLSNYTSTNSGAHQCRVCSRSFLRKSHLEHHALYCGLPKGFICSACAATFGSKSDLVLHRLSTDACYSPEFRNDLSPMRSRLGARDALASVDKLNTSKVVHAAQNNISGKICIIYVFCMSNVSGV